jgi:hypothetical protein
MCQRFAAALNALPQRVVDDAKVRPLQPRSAAPARIDCLPALEGHASRE